MLFELEGDSKDPERVLQYHAAEMRADPDMVEFARGLVFGVLQHRPDIDAELSQASTNWELSQMAKVDRTLLRIATYEIRYLPEVPVKAAINESIELAKAFSGPDSGKFVNGILGKVASGAR